MSRQLMPLKRDETMDAILDVFAEHRNVTTGFLVDEINSTRPTVTKRLDRLYSAGCIEYLHEPTALWSLNYDPRKEK